MIYRFQSGDQVYQITIERRGAAYRAVVEGQVYDLEVLDVQPGEISLRFGERILRLYWASEAGRKWVSSDGCTYLLEKPSPRRRGQPGEGSGEDSVRAPMPAQVRAVETFEGERVERGQTLLLLEAMKMEIRVQAPRAGVISRLNVAQGQSVERDQVLAVIGQ